MATLWNRAGHYIFILSFLMVALCNRADHYIFILQFLSIFYILSFFSSPNLSDRTLDVYHTSTHAVGLSANLECRSEMCGMRIAENAGPKNRHLGTIAQLCWAISSQLRHVSTIGKKVLSSNMSSTCPYNMVNFGPLAAEIGWQRSRATVIISMRIMTSEIIPARKHRSRWCPL